jgi:hypothetical protein
MRNLIEDPPPHRPVGADIIHADGGRDMTKLRATFRKYVSQPKNTQRSVLTMTNIWVPIVKTRENTAYNFVKNKSLFGDSG